MNLETNKQLQSSPTLRKPIIKNKTSEQLNNMVIQGGIKEFIREMISD